MDKPRLKHRPIIVRVGAIVLSLFVAWHIFASFLWIAPHSPLREIVPGDALSNYMIPMFGQSWSVFAPEPINGDLKIMVRAVIEENGEEEATKWVDATEVELSMITYNLFPPRAGIGSSEVASQLKADYDALSEDHKVIAELNYYEDEWDARLEEKMKEYGQPDLVDDFITTEQQALAYATQVAYAIWGENDVQRVQYEVSRQNVIPFAERNDPDAERPDPQIVTTGWRGTVVREGQNSERFAEVFASQYEKIQE